MLVKRTAANQIETCANRKATNTDLYINWTANAPMEWKIGTLRNILKRAKTVCSTTMLLHVEIEHLKEVFTGINEYPIETVNRTVYQEHHGTQKLQNAIVNNGGIQKVQMMLPYNGKHIMLPYYSLCKRRYSFKFIKNRYIYRSIIC